MQSRKWSVLETVTNVGIGWATGLGMQLMIFPMFGIIIPFSTNFYMSIAFTILSIIRGYIVRRYFNGVIMKKMKERP